MNAITPWLDPDEVRQLAARLLSRPEESLPSRMQDAGFGAGFVGYAPVLPTPPSPPVPQQWSPPQPKPAVGAPAPAEAVAPPPAVPCQPAISRLPEPLVPVPGRGPFLDRIARFRDWLQAHFGATGVFILDREGATIFDDGGHEKLHFLARSLALTTRRPGNPSGNIHVRIGASATLEVIPVETPYGWFVLGAVVPEAMAPAAVAVITEALIRAAAPPGTAS